MDRNRKAVRISLNELSITSHKAALGAGVSTGAAEDLAKAVWWLAVRQLPVLRPVLQGLDAVDTARSVFGQASITKNRIAWHSLQPDKNLSAALIGGAASDLLLSLSVSGMAGLYMLDLDCPLLLLPHFASAATKAGLNVHILWATEGAQIELTGTDDRIHIVHSEGDPVQCGRYKLQVTLERTVADLSSPLLFQGAREPDIHRHGYEIEENDWSDLGAFADRNLVRATARSRAVGAGAGLSDND